MQWTVVGSEVWVRCRFCADFFEEVPVGTILAGESSESGGGAAALRLV